MKKVILFAFIAFLTVGFTVAQTTQPEKITVSTADLTPDQLAKIKLQQANDELQSKLDTYGKWVGVGGEIGTAVKEGLTAVVDVADKFGKTDVGHFTMVMVAWKIIGKDIVRIILGLFFIVFITVVIFRSYKNFTVHKIALKTNGWKFWLPKEYQLVEPNYFDGIEFIKICHIFFMAGAFGLTYAIMFA